MKDLIYRKPLEQQNDELATVIGGSKRAFSNASTARNPGHDHSVAADISGRSPSFEQASSEQHRFLYELARAMNQQDSVESYFAGSSADPGVRHMTPSGSATNYELQHRRAFPMPIEEIRGVDAAIVQEPEWRAQEPPTGVEDVTVLSASRSAIDSRESMPQVLLRAPHDDDPPWPEVGGRPGVGGGSELAGSCDLSERFV